MRATKYRERKGRREGWSAPWKGEETVRARQKGKEEREWNGRENKTKGQNKNKKIEEVNKLLRKTKHTKQGHKSRPQHR